MFSSKCEITATTVHMYSTVLTSVSVCKVLMLLVVMSPMFILDFSEVTYVSIKYSQASSHIRWLNGE
jgi:hypothetical protein